MERWLAIDGYEGLYEVSDLGRVRSLPHYTRAGMRPGLVLHPGKVLKQHPVNKWGHLSVMLSMEGKTRRVLVHRLVLLAFSGPSPDGKEQVRHLDGGTANNQLTNLQWGDGHDDALDRVRHGTHPNATKRECVRGHDLTDPTNIRIGSHGERNCRACVPARKAERAR